jgi:hypothetical protein
LCRFGEAHGGEAATHFGLAHRISDRLLQLVLLTFGAALMLVAFALRLCGGPASSLRLTPAGRPVLDSGDLDDVPASRIPSPAYRYSLLIRFRMRMGESRDSARRILAVSHRVPVEAR